MITFDDMAHDGQMITRIIFPSLLGYHNVPIRGLIIIYMMIQCPIVD